MATLTGVLDALSAASAASNFRDTFRAPQDQLGEPDVIRHTVNR